MYVEIGLSPWICMMNCSTAKSPVIFNNEYYHYLSIILLIISIFQGSVVGGVANAAVTGVGAAATASTLTSTASGLKGLSLSLAKAEMNVAAIIGNLSS